MNPKLINDFKRELKELLQKYNAEIFSEMEGDTHGVYNSIIVELDRKEILRFDNPPEITQHDIKHD